jgi:hypothetical protein
MGRTSMRWAAPSSLVRPQPVAASPLLVQSQYADTGAGTAATQAVTLPGAAAAGNLLVAVGASDATIATPAGFTLVASAVNASALYIWAKVAAGGETGVTLTPSVTDTCCVALLEYSGMAASPIDQVATASNTGTTAGPVTAGATPTTTQASELVIAAVNPASFVAASGPTAPSWSGGFTTRLTGATTFGTTAQNQALFVAELVVSSIGAQSTSVSWTNSANAWGAVVATFKGA